MSQETLVRVPPPFPESGGTQILTIRKENGVYTFTVVIPEQQDDSEIVKIKLAAMDAIEQLQRVVQN